MGSFLCVYYTGWRGGHAAVLLEQRVCQRVQRAHHEAEPRAVYHAKHQDVLLRHCCECGAGGCPRHALARRCNRPLLCHGPHHHTGLYSSDLGNRRLAGYQRHDLRLCPQGRALEQGGGGRGGGRGRRGRKERRKDQEQESRPRTRIKNKNKNQEQEQEQESRIKNQESRTRIKNKNQEQEQESRASSPMLVDFFSPPGFCFCCLPLQHASNILRLFIVAVSMLLATLMSSLVFDAHVGLLFILSVLGVLCAVVLFDSSSNSQTSKTKRIPSSSSA